MGWTSLRKFVILVLLLAGRCAWAAPTTADQAQKVVQGWLRLDAAPLQMPLGSAVGQVETFSNPQGQPLYYIVHLLPDGLVIVSADDLVEPIIGFLPGQTYDQSSCNPLAALVNRDLAGRMAAVRDAGMSFAAASDARALLAAASAGAQAKWRHLQDLNTQTSKALSSVSSVSDVRAGPLVESKWNQSTVGNYAGGDACFNYYTPPGPPGSSDNYVCGCTATAMAQIMRFWQFPTAGIGVHAFQIRVNTSDQSATTRGGNGTGGPYNWSLMVLDPDSSTTLEQRQAIGALCYDAGVSARMNYTKDGSGATFSDATKALVNTFGYANAIEGYNSNLDLGAPLNAMVNCNLDAGFPVLLSIREADEGGHAIVGDGYGYNASTLYHHLNMGWGGGDDAWYNLPDVATSNGTYILVDVCVYNIFVSGKGEIISGRITDADGNPVGGVTVTAQRSGGSTYTGTSNNRGVYAIWPVPSASTYTLSASGAGFTSVSQTATTGTSTDSASTSGNCWAVNFVGFEGHPGSLSVSPAEGLTSTGFVGEPCSPASVTYTLSNTGSEAINWTAGNSQPWISLSKVSGMLAAAATDTVVVSFNQAVGDLATGNYSDTVTFTNTSNNNGTVSRPVSLRLSPGRPDFTITSITLDPPSPAAGAAFTATVAVKNRGAGSGNPWYLSVWADRPATAGPRDNVDDYQEPGELAAGQSKTFTFTGLSAGAPGSRVFRASVDSTASTDESDETNNQVTQAYTAAQPLPTISIGDPAESATSLVFPVWLSAASDLPVTVHYTTADGTAKAGTDYTSTSGNLTISAGETDGLITVAITASATPGRTLLVTLSDPANAVLGTATATGTIASPAVIIPGGQTSNGGCGQGVGSANLLAFHAVCWLGLMGMGLGRRQAWRTVRP